MDNTDPSIWKSFEDQNVKISNLTSKVDVLTLLFIVLIVSLAAVAGWVWYESKQISTLMDLSQLFAYDIKMIVGVLKQVLLSAGAQPG